MAFDKTKDKQLVTLGRIEIEGCLPINVGIFQYDGGEIKLGMTRILVTKAGTDDEKTYNKPLGRMNEEEVVALAKILGDERAIRDAFKRAKHSARDAKSGKRSKGEAGEVIKPTTKMTWEDTKKGAKCSVESGTYSYDAPVSGKHKGRLRFRPVGMSKGKSETIKSVSVKAKAPSLSLDAAKKLARKHSKSSK